jgi:hypothetical protein
MMGVEKVDERAISALRLMNGKLMAIQRLVVSPLAQKIPEP